MNINEAVRPLFFDRDPGQLSFAGTGFFVEHYNKVVLLTANHVASSAPLLVCEPTEGKVNFSYSAAMHDTVLLGRSEEFDIAAYEVAAFTPGQSLRLASDTPSTIEKVATLEYARYRIDNDRRLFLSNSSARVGNIVRLLNAEDMFPEKSLELSYPALKGASGAPVVILNSMEVCGLVVGNAQYEVMPVQTYSFTDEDGSSEMTHYYLPAGIAIHVSWIKMLLESWLN